MNSIDLEIKTSLGSGNPLLVLKKWLKESLTIKALKEPWAMVLSTSDRNHIHSRVVLLKYLHKEGLVFYTNYLSLKGRCLTKNPRAAVNFYWPQMGRQICIEGYVKKTSRRQSLLYWKTRHRESQLSQWISQQSQRVSSRKTLEDLKYMAKKEFKNRDIPCPKHWGGYILSIQKIEFWQNQPHRLHNRFLFEKMGKIWKKQRLFP